MLFSCEMPGESIPKSCLATGDDHDAGKNAPRKNTNNVDRNFVAIIVNIETHDREVGCKSMADVKIII